MARSARVRLLAVLLSAILFQAARIANASPPPMGQWEEIATPGPRLDHTAVYDSLRDQMLVFGGHPNDAWIYHFSNQTWTPLQATGVGPSTYADAKAVWDSQRNRVLLLFLDRPFSGNNYAQACELWDLELSPAPHWILLQTQGMPPWYRKAENVLYDAVRDRLLVYGGRSPDDPYGYTDPDLLELPLATLVWNDLTPATYPPARSEAAAVIDVIRDRLVIHGGQGQDSYGQLQPLGDTWVYRLDGSAGWRQLHPTEVPNNPVSQRHDHSAIFDPAGNRMLLYGGINENHPEWPDIGNGVVQLSFGSSTDPDSTASWSYPRFGPDMGPRYGHTALRRTAVPQMVIFGGAADYNNRRQNDVWSHSLDGSGAWTHGPSLGPPDERVATSLVYDPKRHRDVLLGGWNGQFYCDYILCLMFCYGDAWNLELDGASHWVERPAFNIDFTRRGAQSAIYDPVRDRIVVFGGFQGYYSTTFQRLNDVWTLGLDDAGTWSQITFGQGLLPAPRSGHTAIYDPLRDRMIVYGGSYRSGSSDVSLGDLWQLTFAGTPAWTQLSPGGTIPPPHAAHAAIYDPVRDRMIVVGGPDARVWALSLTPSLVWNELPTTGGAPAFGTEVAAVYDPISDHVFVFSGTSAIAVWSLDLSSSPATWAKLTPSGASPPPSNDYAAAYDTQSDRVVLFGLDPLPFGYGGEGTDIGNRTWALNWGRAVPALAALVSAEAGPGYARIVWQVPGGAGTSVSVQRRTAQSDWTTIGDAVADASGLAVFEDHSVAGGTGYGYRLEMGGVFAAETWVDVPAVQASLRIDGARPNPSVHVSLAILLRSAAPAQIEFFDLRGRLMLSRRIEGLEPGPHLVSVPEADALGSGLYLVRLRQDGEVVRSRVTLLR